MSTYYYIQPMRRKEMKKPWLARLKDEHWKIPIVTKRVKSLLNKHQELVDLV